MGLPDAELLDRYALSIVVFGPGYGESIVLRVATNDEPVWAVVDSARRERRGGSVNPALDLLINHGAEPSLVLLTHPHTDHTKGMAAIIERARPGATIACLEPLLEHPSPYAPDADPDDQAAVSHSQTKLAHRAIKAAWGAGKHKWPLVHGGSHDLAGWTLSVLNPDQASLAVAVARLRAGEAVELNELSAAILIKREDVALVLGADCAGAAWGGVEERMSPENLRHARPVKVPHHGSRAAIHPVLIDPAEHDAERPLVVTPFPNSGTLPRFDPGNGIEELLAAAGAVELTAMPLNLVAAATNVTLAEARNAMIQVDFEGDQALQIRTQRPASVSPLRAAVRDPYEAWVALGVEANGEIAVARGAHAVRVLA
jgi:hypothetical protein